VVDVAAGSGDTHMPGEVPDVVKVVPREEKRENTLILDVGMPLLEGDSVPGKSRFQWRSAVRRDVLPRIAAFQPDLVLISAGFDAHRKDIINCGYIGLVEEDYAWITRHLVRLANTFCQGRVVSMLEGGYRVHGGIISAFARSVAAHVRVKQ